MSAAALLARLYGHGIALRAEGDALRYHPRDALTPALLADVQRHKHDLLALLAADDAAIRWRVVVMRQRHPPPWRAVPFLTVCDVPRDRSGCRSCGEPVQPVAEGLTVRCAHCAHAARLVLAGG
jgi:hypothetical protein